MKVVLYHISDLHIEKESDIRVAHIKRMADVLNELRPLDKVILIVSGDIAYAGKREQYDAAYHMFGTLIKEIKDKFHLRWVDICIVPGNHDVDYDMGDEGHAAIQQKVRNGVTEIMIEDELEKQRNYLNYAKGNHCLDENDKLCCIDTVHCGSKEIKICMLNTALFSTLDEDKGLHYIPKNVMEKMREALDSDINITVLHHAHHWMHESIKNEFEDVLYQYNNIVLCGHEHDIESKVIKKNGWKVIYLTGGELCNRGNWSDSEFYVNVIDTEKMTMNSLQYIWNRKRRIYNKRKEEKYSLKDMNTKKIFEMDEEFNSWLYSDQVNSISNNMFDYYVFPDLERIREYSSVESEFVKETEDFVNTVIDKKRVVVIGGDSSGKTSLLKKLFIELNNIGYYCLYCDSVLLRNLSLKKLPLTVFRNNYVDIGGSYDEFMQIPKEKKVFLLDNINDIDKTQILSILAYLKEFFGVIVYTAKEIIEFDLAERVKQTAELEDYTRYKLLPMYMKKRKVLISKIVGILDNSADIENMSNNIAGMLKSQRKFYSMNPSFIIQYTDFYLKNFKDAFATDGNIFSKVFENNIINKVRPVAKRLTVDKILILLDKIAYWCYKEQKSEIAQECICSIIDQYNERHGDEVEYVSLITACRESKILKTSGGENRYRFADKNILSYFIAREIIRLWNDKLDDTDLKNLIKYIRYGINSNIILFITYLTDNLYLIRNILDSTIQYMKDWSAFDIVNVNIPYLALLNGTISLDAPTQQDREKSEEKEKQEDKDEIKQYEDSQLIVKDYFDSDIDQCEELCNQLIRSMSLLDIASKCLPGFEHRMEKEDKEKALHIIFNLPAKIFYVWAAQVEEDKKELVEFLLEEYRTAFLDPRDWDKVNEDDMMRYLQMESLSLFLDLLSIPVGNAAKDYTIRYLSNYSENKGLLYQIQMLMAYGKLDMVPEFETYLKSIDSNFKKCIPDYMKRRVLRHYLVTSKRISNEKLQQLVSKYFHVNRPNKVYRDILISRERNERKQ